MLRGYQTLTIVAPAARPNTTHSVNALPPRRLSPWIPPTICHTERNVNQLNAQWSLAENLSSSKNPVNRISICTQEVPFRWNAKSTLHFRPHYEIILSFLIPFVLQIYHTNHCVVEHGSYDTSNKRSFHIYWPITRIWICRKTIANCTIIQKNDPRVVKKFLAPRIGASTLACFIVSNFVVLFQGLHKSSLQVLLEFGLLQSIILIDSSCPLFSQELLLLASLF